MTERYVELHARSAFSFLRGAAMPDEYIEALDGDSMALTDIDGVQGAVRFYKSAGQRGIRAHVGSEVTAFDGTRWTLLVKSREGYQNLCRLVTRMKLRAGAKHPKPGEEAAATLEDFAEFSNGLLCLTGGEEGPLARSLQNGTSGECLNRLLHIFGRENVYVELQRHFDREEERRNQAAMEVARRLQLPLVATNGVTHASPLQREVLDVFTCLHHKTTLAAAGRLLARNSERHLKNAGQMSQIFSDLPEAILNTREIASRLNFTVADLGYEFPHYPVAPGETEPSLLHRLTHEGARKRYGARYEEAVPQLEKELALIEKLGFSGYFLIVWDIVQYCQKQGILVQGRGSAANSAVCYSLEITAIDPVKRKLLFERFLTEERGEWPDIDMDLPSGDQRERAIQYVYERYGSRGAAMTANVISYRGRMAAREAGKVLGFPEETLHKLSRLVPTWGWIEPDDTTTSQFREAGLDPADPRIRKFLDITIGLKDRPRHLGQHSGGMVICRGQLDSIVPLEPSSMPNRVVTQWDKDDCADMKIIKVDLLGLGMMALLKDCIGLIRDHWQENIDLGQLPSDDTKVYETLRKADTIGLFQVESRAQQATLPRLRPENFDDLVIQIAIVRPGPIAGQMMHPYLKRRAKREPVIPLHPLLEQVLERTLGVPLFQEQLLRMSMVAANFTGGEAEELRRAMGFKRSEQRMKEIEKKLRAGMEANGITGETQNRIVLSITSFALYGFPESHAASFALLAYASAYFKCHYLAAFTCALLNNQPMGFYSSAVIVKDAQRHGLRVLPAEVNTSEWKCTVEGKDRNLRLGLCYVRGLKKSTAELIAERKPFHDVDDLARRVPAITKTELEALAGVGALAKLQTAHRRDALWKAGRAGRTVGPLLSDVPETLPVAPLRPMTTVERLSADYAGTSLTIGHHPMFYRRAEMNELGVTRAGDLGKVPSGRMVRVAGCVIVRQRPGTAKGVVFISLEDETGIANAVVMPDMFQEQRFLIVDSPWLMIEGKLQNVDNVIHVLALRITPLESESLAMHSHNFH